MAGKKLLFSSIILILFGFSLFYFLSTNSSDTNPPPSRCIKEGNDYYIPGNILVKFKESISKKQAGEIIEQLGGKIVTEYDFSNLFLIGVPKGKEKEYMEKFQNYSSTEYSQLNHCVDLATP